MDTNVGITVLSMMTTVITFFLGFMWLHVGRLLGEVSRTTGFLKGVADRIHRIGSGEPQESELADLLSKKARRAGAVRRKVERKVGALFVACVGCVFVLLVLLSAVGSFEVWILVVVGWLAFIGGMIALGYGTIVSMRMYHDYVELSGQREASLG